MEASKVSKSKPINSKGVWQHSWSFFSQDPRGGVGELWSIERKKALPGGFSSGEVEEGLPGKQHSMGWVRAFFGLYTGSESNNK